MLTLKAPIQVHIGQTLTAGAVGFSERILGNYGLLGAHFAPKDLLFLVTAPPELPEETGGMTTLVDQSSTVDVRSVTLDVVNNVVNRILLDGTQHFTYQDQVYITTVLHRLGITDVSQFMQQVRALRVENESIVHMTKLYREGLTRIEQRQAAGESAPSLPLPPHTEEGAAQPPADPRVTLALAILKRMDTASTVETIRALTHTQSGTVGVLRDRELRLAEQLRMSDSFTLAQLKERVYERPRLQLVQHTNLYETGGLLDAPQSSEQVLSQAAAAALLSVVDSTIMEVFHRPELRHEQWLELRQALYRTSENTLARFEDYHSRAILQTMQSFQAELAWSNFAQEIREYSSFYHQVYPRAALTPARSAEEVQEDEPTSLLPRAERWPVWDENAQKLFEQIIHAETAPRMRMDVPPLAAEMLPQFQPPQPSVQSTVLRHELERLEQSARYERVETIHPAPVRYEQDETEQPPIFPMRFVKRQPEQASLRPQPPQFSKQSAVLRRELERLEQSERYERVETIYPTPERVEQTDGELQPILSPRIMERQSEQPFPPVPLTPAEAEQPSVFPMHLAERWPEQASLRPQPPQHSTQSAVLRRELERLEQSEWHERVETIYPAPEQSEQTDGEQQPILSPRIMERQSAQPFPPVPLTLTEAEESAPEVLREEIARIDQRNRTILEKVRNAEQKSPTALPSAPDIRRTMRDALRALDQPETVLRELYDAGTEAPELQHPTFTPAEQVLLSQADAGERKLYETVLSYQKDPEGTLAKGLLRPGNQGALHAALREAVREAPPELTHPSPEPAREEATYRPASEAVERLLRESVRPQAPTQEASVPPPAMKFVHKQNAAETTEELLEQMDERRRTETQRIETKEHITRETSHQVDVNQIERRVMAQTTEDIAELVNRTLARQMRNISDQVYRQMEKRLQSERSRRGRL